MKRNFLLKGPSPSESQIRLRVLNKYRSMEGLLASNYRNSQQQYLIGVTLHFLDRFYGGTHYSKLMYISSAFLMLHASIMIIVYIWDYVKTVNYMKTLYTLPNYPRWHNVVSGAVVLCCLFLGFLGLCLDLFSNRWKT